MAKTVFAIASDHAGFDLKTHIQSVLGDEFEFIDLGTHSIDSVNYADYGYAIADAVAGGEAAMGIAICGTGIGISIAANRHPAIRAAVCTSVEMAKLARMHNDANILALGARIIDPDLAVECVRVFAATGFEGGRHIPRVQSLCRIWQDDE